MIKYKDFYHYMIQPKTSVTIIDDNFVEIYKGKGFMMEDDIWNKIKDWYIYSAGLATDAPEFMIMLSRPKNNKLAFIKN